MRNPFRHRKQIRKHEDAHRAHNLWLGSNSVTVRNIGAPSGLGELSTKNFDPQVGITPYNPYHGSMSGEEVNPMNKSYRVAMAQALLTELAEATARYGSDNEGVKRLHRMVRTMVAELLA